ncbi:MAG TPA: bifunctional proline dehydrogenase/L-glutamate gamma-semialdehyde dehydrogenase [Gryllotalpicola sp.]
MTDLSATTPAPASADPEARAERTTALVRRWLQEAAGVPVGTAARRLAGVLRDPTGLDFAVGFVDGVVRPEDTAVAARNLAALAPTAPAFLSPLQRGALRLGGLLAPALPAVVVPIARRVLRGMVGHLIIDASDSRLGQAIERVRRGGVRLNVNLLGEAVLGRREADRRLEETVRLLSRPDVDYVSVKVSAVVGPHSPWAFDEAVRSTVDKLLPLFRRAAAKPGHGFVNLDMEEYRDLDLTIAVFTQLLDRPEFHGLEAGIVLQAYLPDALSAMMRLQSWAATRVASGGARIKVRLVKGANLSMERVESSLRGWPLATWDSKQETDANYKRVLDFALRPAHTAHVRLGIAGHNLFDIADAWLTAVDRGVTDAVEFEMLLGMAEAQAEVVRRTVGGLLLYTPVVHPKEFDVAIAYLIRRLEEGASPDNFMSAVFELATDGKLFARERERYLNSLRALDAAVPAPKRRQDRRAPEPATRHDRFENVVDTDPSLPANREWAAELLGRATGSRLGEAGVAAARLETPAQLEDVISGAVEAAPAWGGRGGAERAELLHRAGDALASARAELAEVMAAEAAKTIDQADPEISEAIDFAHYYAELARELDAVDGARFEPARLTVVTPPWNFPVSIPVGSTLAALAAGSAVLLKPAPEAQRCAAVFTEALWAAGIPREVLRLVVLDESSLGTALIAHPAVDRVILTGSYETAELFRRIRPDLPLLAETSGKNSVIVTPSADLDLAVRDIVASAFGHAGQKCSAASLAILVGPVARSERFRRQLVDAVESLHVGEAHDPAAQMGPLITPASGKLLEGLTALEPGQSWLVEPRRLDEEGRLWGPGVREGVAAGSRFHRVEYFGPVLGIMTADSLDEAIELQNGVDYGLTAGLHSLDREEIASWLDRVEAGNLYVNRGITGAVVRRQPFGGWKRSAVGAGTKAGGPNYLIGLGSWQPAPTGTGTGTGATAAAGAPASEPLAARVRELLAAGRTAGLATDELAALESSAASDARAWAGAFGVARDVSALTAERNVLRYRPVAVAVRMSADARPAELLRVGAAGALSGARFEVSAAAALPGPIARELERQGVAVRTESAEQWAGRVAGSGVPRARVLGSDAAVLTAATAGSPDLAVYGGAVTEAGRIELLPFLHEQAISITAHRFGTPHQLAEGLFRL